jgi:virulence-associated protein VagC
MVYQIYRKKLFKHGGSRAVDLPKEAHFGDQEVIIEIREEGIFIYSDVLTNMESDPRFHLFVEALFEDAMKNPDQLKNLEEVWDEEWDDLLRGVDLGDEA